MENKTHNQTLEEASGEYARREWEINHMHADCCMGAHNIREIFLAGAAFASKDMVPADVVQGLVDALRFTDRQQWFDRTVKNGIACIWCDCGDAGEEVNQDGHDASCAVSIIHYALIEFQTWKEKRKG